MSLANFRPRGVGEILDATFSFYRTNVATCLTVAIIVVAPPAIIKAVVPADLAALINRLGNLLIPIAQGAIAAMVAASVERDDTLDVASAFRATVGRKRSLIGAQVISSLAVGVGLVLLIVPGFIFATWTAVCVPVVMMEQLGASKAVERSRALVRGRVLPVLGAVLLAWGIALVVIIGVGAVAGAVAGTAGTALRVINLLAELIFAFALPVPAIAMTFLYYDLRVRTESADLDAMVSALPTPTPGL